MEGEIVLQFGSPTVAGSDNSTCFTTKKLTNFMNSNAFSWIFVLEYVPMRNRRAERILGILELAVKRLSLGTK